METKDVNSKANYQKIITDLIPDIKVKEAIPNGEKFAKVYSVDDKYILKRYLDIKHESIETHFYPYYKEMSHFHEQGMNVPEFYDFYVNEKYADVLFFRFLCGYDFYILQEKIDGEIIDRGFLDEDYFMFADLCSEEEFKEVLKRPKNNIKLFSEIMTRYARSFLAINERLESMDEKHFEKFILDSFGMFLQGVYTKPDLHSSNIFLTDSGLKIIDNQMLESPNTIDSEIKRMQNAFVDLFYMLEHNTELRENIKNNKNYLLEVNNYYKLLDLLTLNIELIKEISFKLARITHKLFDDSNILNKKTSRDLYKRFTSITNKYIASDIVEEIQNIFDK